MQLVSGGDRVTIYVVVGVRSVVRRVIVQPINLNKPNEFPGTDIDIIYDLLTQSVLKGE